MSAVAATLARVVGVHPESHSVDLVCVDDGRKLQRVRVMTGSATTNTGFQDLAMPDLPAGEDRWTQGGTSGTRDAIACVLFFGPVPVVIGFLPPRGSEMRFPDEGRAIYRHGSDVYWTVDQAGNLELAHPSGAYIRIGEDLDHEDLAGRDRNGTWNLARNTDTTPGLRVSIGGSVIDVTADGKVNITASELHVSGKITAGGNIESAANVKAGTIILNSHTHSGVQPGGGSTGGPQ